MPGTVHFYDAPALLAVFNAVPALLQVYDSFAVVPEERFVPE